MNHFLAVMTSPLEQWLRMSSAVPLMWMYFLLLITNTLVRDTKDTLLVISPAGVEAIPLLKSWVVIPASLIFFVIFYRLDKTHTQRELLVLMMLFFNAFYILFAIFLFPMMASFTPTTLSAYLERTLPTNAQAIRLLLENWILGLYYVVSELWASAICSFMFWNVANNIMTVTEAKSTYPLIGASGNAGMIVAGTLLRIFADRRDADVRAKAYLRIPAKGHGLKHYWSSSTAQAEHRAWQGSLILISFIMFISCGLIVLAYDAAFERKINALARYSKYDDDLEEQIPSVIHDSHTGNVVKRRTNSGLKHVSSLIDSKKERKKGISVSEALLTLSRSRPLRAAALLVVSYGVSISLVEVSWKGQVKRSFPEPNDYSRFMGSFWTLTGMISMLLMVLGRWVMQKYGYGMAVMFTPTIMAISGTLFFSVTIFQDLFQQQDTISPWAAYFGGCAVLVAKAAKYSFFDATKEIIFIPLDDDSKNIGKAAIDVIAYRMSKSGGSIVLQIVIVLFGSLSGLGTIPIAMVFGLVVGAWIYGALTAKREMEKHGEEELGQTTNHGI